MPLFVGLGNPGAKYAHNRHNIGFMAIDAIAREYNFPLLRKRFQGLASEGSIGPARILLLEPQTYMNESGRAVAEAARFHKIDLADIVVFHDELDLPPGKLRVKTGGGDAGHNGLRSITAHLGKDYRRVRLGIGHPGDKDRVSGHVLQNFSADDIVWLKPLVGAMVEAAPLLARDDDKGFMSKVALLLQPPKEPTKKKDTE